MLKIGSALFAMARPMQLLAVTLVYMMGTGIGLATSDASLNIAVWWVGYLALIPVSASIHYANEYADYETDVLTIRTPFSGGSGALVKSGVERHVAIIAAWIALVIGTVIALGALFTGQLSAAALGVLFFGAFFGWMYSLPPLMLAWRGWGELDNAMLGGVALPLYGYAVQTGQVDWEIVLTTLPFGMLVFINLLATTWPDRQADAAVGKRTLATRRPTVHLRILYLLAMVSAFALLLAYTGWLIPLNVTVASFLALPVAIWGSITYTRWHTPLPTVAAMAFMLIVQVVMWWLESGYLVN